MTTIRKNSKQYIQYIASIVSIVGREILILRCRILMYSAHPSFFMASRPAAAGIPVELADSGTREQPTQEQPPRYSGT